LAVRVHRDIEYGSAPIRQPRVARKTLRLDLYQPEGRDAPRPRPAFVAVHGGGLTVGSRRNENIVQLCEELAARGWVCASIDYRLRGDDPPAPRGVSSDATLAAAVEDARRAVRWLRRRASRLGLDPRRIAVGGSSAGATIALRAAYMRPRRRSAPAAVFAWSGELYTTTDVLEAGEPPLFVVYGTADTMVEAAPVRALIERAHAVGIPYEAYFCAGVGHNAPLDRRPDGVSLYDRLAAFLHRELDLAGPGSPLARRSRPPARGTPAGLDPVPCPH
jgi:acetyl esterase/lipase